MKRTPLILVVAAFMFASCGKKKSCNPIAFADVGASLSVALTAYAGNPSVANCLVYVEAVQAYLDVVDGCDFVTEAEVEEARKDLNEANCQ